jgi:hypothetical protein
MSTKGNRLRRTLGPLSLCARLCGGRRLGSPWAAGTSGQGRHQPAARAPGVAGRDGQRASLRSHRARPAGQGGYRGVARVRSGRLRIRHRRAVFRGGLLSRGAAGWPGQPRCAPTTSRQALLVLGAGRCSRRWSPWARARLSRSRPPHGSRPVALWFGARVRRRSRSLLSAGHRIRVGIALAALMLTMGVASAGVGRRRCLIRPSRLPDQNGAGAGSDPAPDPLVRAW